MCLPYDTPVIFHVFFKCKVKVKAFYKSAYISTFASSLLGKLQKSTINVKC